MEDVELQCIKEKEQVEQEQDQIVIYAKNTGVGESFKRYIINTLKDLLSEFDFIEKVTLNKIIFKRDITYDDIIQLRHLCKTIKTDIFAYKC